MQGPVRVHIADNHKIPRRIVNLLEGRTLTCGLTGATATIANGAFDLRLDGKSATVLA
jgi:hypothetical protein